MWAGLSFSAASEALEAEMMTRSQQKEKYCKLPFYTARLLNAKQRRHCCKQFCQKAARLVWPQADLISNAYCVASLRGNLEY